MFIYTHLTDRITWDPFLCSAYNTNWSYFHLCKIVQQSHRRRQSRLNMTPLAVAEPQWQLWREPAVDSGCTIPEWTLSKSRADCFIMPAVTRNSEFLSILRFNYVGPGGCLWWRKVTRRGRRPSSRQSSPKWKASRWPTALKAVFTCGALRTTPYLRMWACPSICLCIYVLAYVCMCLCMSIHLSIQPSDARSDYEALF